MDAFRICCFLVLYQICTIHAAIECKNQQNQPVDWFIVYKMPKILTAQSPDIAQGIGFYYMDAAKQQWTFSKDSIQDKSQAVYYTLEQIYTNKQSQNVMYLMMNDQSPGAEDSASKGYQPPEKQDVSFKWQQSPEKQNSSIKGHQPPKKQNSSFRWHQHIKELNSSSRGHTKGEVVFDKTSGFWLVHSVPKFPPKSGSSYTYPDSATSNGQTLLCMTYAYGSLKAIGEQLKYNYPLVYDSNLPKSFADENPAIADVVAGKSSCDPPYYRIADIESKSGQAFKSFAKCATFNQDLYHGLVALKYRKNMYAETWRNGAGVKIPSTCTGYKVENVEEVTFDKAAGVVFRSTKDHSKWTISENPGPTCIGDVNRMESQKKRGGGTVCLDDPSVWTNFKSKITSSENCTMIYREEFTVHTPELSWAYKKQA